MERLRDSFMSLANEYRISERWREHFEELFNEIEKNNKRCIDCNMLLPEGFKNRCPACYDKIYFP